MLDDSIDFEAPLVIWSLGQIELWRGLLYHGMHLFPVFLGSGHVFVLTIFEFSLMGKLIENDAHEKIHKKEGTHEDEHDAE